jgi:hypothetical protein
METLIGTLEYKGYSIEQDPDYDYSGHSIIIYPTEQGIQHDEDFNGERTKYCGNCKWADSVEEAKEIIDEITESRI